MDLEKLKVFYQVVKQGSISAAAQKLRIAQSAVSRSISMLEAEFNTQLFIRPGGAKGVVLTDVGQILFKSAKKILDIENFTTIEIEDYSREPFGTIKIVTSLGLINFWLVDIIKEFTTLHPQLNLILEGYNEVDINFETFDADVVIGPNISQSPELIQYYLMSYQLKMFASEDYLKTFGTPKTVADLDNHRIIIFSTSRKSFFGNVDWHLNLGCPPGVSRKPFLQVNSSLALKKAADQGLGIISINPNFPGTENLIQILPEVEGHRVDIFYSHHRNFKNSKRLIALLEFLKRSISESNYYIEKSRITP